MLVSNLLFLCVSALLNPVQAERCFHCTNVEDPTNCTTVTTCGPDQMCSLRQFVTPEGSVLYSSQCLDKTKCGTLSQIVGRRHVAERATDVTTCYQCCDKDLCNNEGCSTKAVPRDQRGPYCYTCDASLDPSACNDVSICKENEQCIVYISPELSSTSQPVYKSMCESKTACTALSHIYGNSSCLPMCCEQDFCNDHCNMVAQATDAPFVCDLDAGYQIIRDGSSHTELCVQIHTNMLDWDSARAACITAGGDLVILESREKAVLMRTTVIQEHKYTREIGYWIGARDFDLSNNFLWVNNQTVDVLDGDWDVNQPNHHDGGHDQDCAAMWRGSPLHFQWHDDFCPKHLGYICQQS